MSTENFNLLVQVAVLVLSIVVGFGGIVPIVNGLKGLLSINGRLVQVLAVVVAFVLALLTGLAQGLLAPESFTAAQFMVTTALMLTLSQTEYGRWLRQQSNLPENGGVAYLHPSEAGE